MQSTTRTLRTYKRGVPSHASSTLRRTSCSVGEIRPIPCASARAAGLTADR
jgi:hypothetical protein